MRLICSIDLRLKDVEKKAAAFTGLSVDSPGRCILSGGNSEFPNQMSQMSYGVNTKPSKLVRCG